MVERSGIVLLVAAMLLSRPAWSEEVTLRVGEPLARADLLKPGTQRYVRYLIKDGHRAPLDIWVRTISLERLNGKPIVRVAQQWDGAGPAPTLRVEQSVMEAGTMRPISHYRLTKREGKVTSSAYRFESDRVVGDRSLAENSAKDFTKVVPRPVYNFVPDIEWFRQLPMRQGRVFVADLYDPGSGEPDQFKITVASTERITGPDGRLVECWLVTTDYNHPERGLTRYWFAKSNQYLIRQEVDAGEHGYLVKILLPPEAADAGSS